MCELILNQLRQSKLPFEILGRLLKVRQIDHLIQLILHTTDVGVKTSNYKIA